MSELRRLLQKYDVEIYYDVFREHRIGADILPDITEEDLQSLGIPLGDRKRILRLVRDLQKELDREVTNPSDDADDRGKAETAADVENTEIRQITVVFADLVGSTQLAEQLDIEDNHALLMRFQKLCSEIVTEGGGHPIREAGDGLLACFGFPTANENDAERASLSALRIVAAIPQIATRGKHDLFVRVGIATGMAITNDLLFERQPNISPATGAIFNLAARIQSLAGPGAVFIDDDTRRIIGDKFACEDAGWKNLKGFSEEKHVWQLISVRQRLSLPEEISAQTFTPLVGRSEELDFLRLRWHASDHKSHVVLVTGEPGIGKSRLVKELIREITPLSRDIIWMQCSADDTLRPFHPFIQAIEDISGLAEIFEPEERQARFTSWIREVEHFSPMAAEAFAHLLSFSESIGDGLDETIASNPKRAIFEALLQLFRQLALDHPLLVVIEDIHWIDPSTEEFLDFLHSHLADLKIVVICTYRPEYRPNLLGEPSVSLISLTRLGEKQASRVVGELLGKTRLPPDVTEDIISKTDGVPLFLEELTKSVIESRAHGAQQDGRLVSPLTETQAPLPTTLLGSLTARLHRIDGAKKVAPVGAAIGRSFSRQLLLSVCDLPESKVANVLHGLVTADLLTRVGPDTGITYRFKHSLVQDAAYQTLTKSRRTQLHARIGEALESYPPGARGARPETLARHFFLANAHIKSSEYWLRAATEATRSSAGKEAVAYIEAAIDANRQTEQDTGQRDREIELREALYVPLQVANWGSSKISSNMERLQELRLARGDVEELLDILHAQSGYHIICGNVGKARELAENMLERYEDDIDARFLALRCIGFCSFLNGDFDKAISELTEVVCLNEKVNRDRIRKFYQADTKTIVQAMICWAHAWKRDIDSLKAAAGLVESHVNGSDDRWTNVYALTIVASAYQTIGDADTCCGYIELARPIAHEIDSDYWMGWLLILSGWVNAVRDYPAIGIREIEEGIEIYRSTGSSQTLPYAKTLLAEALMIDKKLEEAHVLLKELALHREPTEVRYVDAGVERLAEALKRQGQLKLSEDQAGMSSGQ